MQFRACRSLLCLLLSLANGYRVGVPQTSRAGRRLRMAGVVIACEKPKDLAVELQARQAARPERRMSKGLPEVPGTEGLPPAAQIAVTLLLVAIASLWL